MFIPFRDSAQEECLRFLIFVVLSMGHYRRSFQYFQDYRYYYRCFITAYIVTYITLIISIFIQLYFSIFRY